MRLGTWNLEHAAGPARNALRLQHLHAADADIWVLTETHDDIDLGPAYATHTTSPRTTGRAGSRWTTLWSRYPILERIPTRDPHRTLAARVDAPSGPLVVYGTVLPWGSDPGPTGLARGWTEHHRVIAEQVEEWQALRRAHPDASLCIAGDLNMSLASLHSYGTAQGRVLLHQGLSTLGLTCVTARPSVQLERLRHPPIDHVIVSDDLAARAQVVASGRARRPMASG